MAGGVITAAWILAAGTAYAGYKQAEAARKQADASRRATAAARENALNQIKQMQTEAAQRQRNFETQIAQTRAQTAATAEASRVSQMQANQQMAQQRSQSALMIHQQQLQAAIANQQNASNVGRTSTRRRVGTPQELRTKLEIDSPLTQGSSLAMDSGATPSGGLNV